MSGTEALNQSRNVWLVYFYAPPADADRAALLRLSTVSLILFAGKLLEAFDDTLIGWWSDRARSRFGRRIPFVLAGAPPMALFAFLLFVPPANAGTFATALYLFLTLELFYLCSTFTIAPYDALLPEIARSREERLSVSGLRVYFGVFGAAVGLVGSGLLVAAFGFPAMAAIMALLALATRFIGLAGIWRLARTSVATAPVPFRDAARLTLDDRVFLRFLVSFVLFQAALGMLIGLLPYYVSGILGRDSEGIWVSLLTAVGIGSMAVSIPFFARLARRTSPMQGYRMAMLASATAFPILFLSGLVPGVPNLVEALVILAIVGAPLAGVYLFPGPIVADLCDLDSVRTGARREGVFYGTQAFVEKLAVAIAPLLLGLILLIGNTAESPLGIRLVGPVAGLIVMIGWLIVRNTADQHLPLQHAEADVGDFAPDYQSLVASASAPSRRSNTR